MSVQKRNNCLNIAQKIEILNCLANKTKTRKQLAAQFGVYSSTIGRIVRMKDELTNVAHSSGNTTRKRLRNGKYEAVDRAVATWFRQMRENNNHTDVSGRMLMDEAKRIAQMLDIREFTPNNGWLSRWKARENVKFKRTQHRKKSNDSTQLTTEENRCLSATDDSIHLTAAIIKTEEEDEDEEMDEMQQAQNIFETHHHWRLSPKKELNDVDEHNESYGDDSLEHGSVSSNGNYEQSVVMPPTRNDTIAAIALIRVYLDHNNIIDLTHIDALENQIYNLS
jgi:hypothetical protein